MRLIFPWDSLNSNKTQEVSNSNSEESSIEAGKILKARREKYGLSRNELAKKTMITTSVLEAIENGWLNKLPEKAYLPSMLSRLEEKLDLPLGSLNGILNNKLMSTDSQILPTFTPGNIDLFSTWQGSIVYCIAIIGSLFALNHQQRNIAYQNQQSLRPISPRQSTDQSTSEISKGLLGSPLNNEINSKDKIGKYKTLRNTFLGKFINPKKPGWLIMEISNPSNLLIKSGQDVQAKIGNVKGSIRMRLIPPVLIKSDPPLASKDKIKWKGKELNIDSNNNGSYKLEDLSNSLLAPTNERPQKTPRSP